MALTASLAACSSVCRVTTVATLPIGHVGPLPTVPVKLDGRPTQMAIDTGAQGTAIIPEAATALDLPIDGRHDTLVGGVAGGAVDVPNIQLDHITLGSVDAGPLSVPRAALFGPSFGVLPVAGLIGADILDRYDIELDFPAGTMTLHDVDGCTEVHPGWSQPYTTVPARLTRRQHLVIPVLLDGHPLSALFDTGASSAGLSHASLAKLGLTQASLGGDARGRGYGVNGLDDVLQLHRFDSIVIGGDRIDHPRIGIFANNLDDADMLLGEDYMHTRKFWLSYSTGRLFIQDPPVPAATR